MEINLEHAVDRLADGRKLVERGLEQAPLHDAADGGNQDDEAGMQRLHGIKLPEVAGIIGDEDEIGLAGGLAKRAL